MVRCRGVDSLATVGRFVLEQGYICQQQIHIVNIFILEENMNCYTLKNSIIFYLIEMLHFLRCLFTKR